MTFGKQRETIQAILRGTKCIRPGSVYDPVSARIAEDLGFELGMLGGSTASLTVLGDPDLVLISLSELAETVRRITRAAKLAADGRCRPRLWQRAERAADDRGTGNIGCRRSLDRGHAAAAGLRAVQGHSCFRSTKASAR